MQYLYWELWKEEMDSKEEIMSAITVLTDLIERTDIFPLSRDETEILDREAKLNLDIERFCIESKEVQMSILVAKLDELEQLLIPVIKMNSSIQVHGILDINKIPGA